MIYYIMSSCIYSADAAEFFENLHKNKIDGGNSHGYE